MKARFITIEGCEGSGKTTILKMINDLLTIDSAILMIFIIIIAILAWMKHLKIIC